MAIRKLLESTLSFTQTLLVQCYICNAKIKPFPTCKLGGHIIPAGGWPGTATPGLGGGHIGNMGGIGAGAWPALEVVGGGGIMKGMGKGKRAPAIICGLNMPAGGIPGAGGTDVTTAEGDDAWVEAGVMAEEDGVAEVAVVPGAGLEAVAASDSVPFSFSPYNINRA